MVEQATKDCFAIVISMTVHQVILMSLPDKDMYLYVSYKAFPCARYVKARKTFVIVAGLTRIRPVIVSRLPGSAPNMLRDSSS